MSVSIDFLFDKESGPLVCRLLFRDGDHRGVGPMAGAERVVDVDVGESGEFFGEFGITFLFPGWNQVENDDLPS